MVAVGELVDLDKAAEEGRDLTATANESMAIVQHLNIPGDVSYREAVVLIAEIKEQAKELLLRRDAISRPLRLALKELNELFDPGIKALEEAEQVLKAKVLEANSRMHAEADKLMAEGSESGDHRLIVRADATRPPDMKGVSIQRTWDGDVVDENALPRDYLTPDLKKLKKVTKAGHGQVSIPGWKPKLVERMAITVEKIERDVP